jgi:hypothetical protein
MGKWGMKDDTAPAVRRQGWSSQGGIECLHAKLPGDLLTECPDCGVRTGGSGKIIGLSGK